MRDSTGGAGAFHRVILTCLPRVAKYGLIAVVDLIALFLVLLALRFGELYLPPDVTTLLLALLELALNAATLGWNKPLVTVLIGLTATGGSRTVQTQLVGLIWALLTYPFMQQNAEE